MAEIYKPVIFDCESQNAFLEGAGGMLLDTILDTNAEQGVVRLAFSGGSSLTSLLKKVQREHGIPWDQLELFQLDERYVAPDAPESNQRQLREIFVDHLEDVKEFNIFRTQYPIQEAAEDYAGLLDSLDGKYFDLVVLGVGPDGHIASLFPQGDYLKHQDSSVVTTVAPPEFAVSQRLSLTLESILNAEQIMLVVTGEKKKHVLREMLEGKLPATHFPVKFLLAHPQLTIFHYPKDE
jgi:6-phosphogluconolactonase